MEYSVEKITKQVENAYAELKSKGYDTSWWSVDAAVEEAIKYFDETGNGTAEIRYDGVKFFTVEAN